MRGCLVVAIAVGCGSRQPAPPPTSRDAGPGVATAKSAEVAPPRPLDEDLDRLAERSVALYGEIARAFDAAGERCATATAKLDDITLQFADVIAANAKILHQGREMSLKIALRRFDDQFQKAAKAIVHSKTLAACYQDEAFTAALDKLVGARP